MRHPFEKYLITRDNYLEKPYDVIDIANTQLFNKSPIFPGARTDNLLSSPDPEVRRFAEWFTNQLCYDVFPGISLYETFLCFHRSDTYADTEFNTGWVHNDVGNLAGLIYLTPDEDSIDTGTSIFGGETCEEELPGDSVAREKFYIHGEVTDAFRNGFQRNQDIFKSRETIRVGNKFNRLVAYDSKMWHRPNNYSTKVGQPRLTLLFFISQFNFFPRPK